MGNKKKGGKKPAAAASAANTQANGSAKDAPNKPTTPATPVEAPSKPPSPVPPTPADEGDNKARAEKTKEQGNTAFKAGKYNDAVDLYTKAIELNTSEPSYLTNRAASYIALKKFRPALEDCQLALSVQTSSKPPAPDGAKVKTLLRLGRCQLALGETAAASSSCRTVLTLEPGNSQAKQLQVKVNAVAGHLKNLEEAKNKKDWGMARLSLDKCFQSLEGEGAEVPMDWRVWRIELELCKTNWDAAGIAANDALRLNPNSPDILTARGLVLFLTGKLPQAQQHVTSALRLDPGHEAARRLRVRVKDVDRLKEEGNVAFKSGKWEEAIELYGGALRVIGTAEEEGRGGQIRATLLSNRATTLLKLNRHEEALEDTDASLSLSPTSFKALRTRARINVILEKYDAGIADFKSAIQQAQTDGSTSEAEVRALKTELKKAEADLKRSKTKDYYKILGVSKECTEIEIKKAYRRESLKHHPDKGGDEEKFKLVVEAHAVLSDPQRRQRYDVGEDEDGGMSGGGGFGGPGGYGMAEEDLANIFMAFGGGGFSFGGPGGGRRGHSHGFSF